MARIIVITIRRCGWRNWGPVYLRMAEQQPNNPLHGKTLETIVTELANHYGWDELAERIPVNCFITNPSVKSSLTFLRKTPWARKKVEDLYLDTFA
jgi:uncharacterized protein (DUF2132 family)